MKWNTVILWIAAVLLSLPASLLVAALLLEQSPSARAVILAKAQRYVSESAGIQLEIHDFRFSLLPLRIQLREIAARNRGAQPMVLWLQIEHVAADIKVDSVFKRQWHLQNLVVHRPIVRALASRISEKSLPEQ